MQPWDEVTYEKAAAGVPGSPQRWSDLCSRGNADTVWNRNEARDLLPRVCPSKTAAEMLDLVDQAAAAGEIGGVICPRCKRSIFYDQTDQLALDPAAAQARKDAMAKAAKAAKAAKPAAAATVEEVIDLEELEASSPHRHRRRTSLAKGMVDLNDSPAPCAGSRRNPLVAEAGASLSSGGPSRHERSPAANQPPSGRSSPAHAALHEEDDAIVLSDGDDDEDDDEDDDSGDGIGEAPEPAPTAGSAQPGPRVSHRVNYSGALARAVRCEGCRRSVFVGTGLPAIGAVGELRFVRALVEGHALLQQAAMHVRSLKRAAKPAPRQRCDSYGATTQPGFSSGYGGTSADAAVVRRSLAAATVEQLRRDAETVSAFKRIQRGIAILQPVPGSDATDGTVTLAPADDHAACHPLNLALLLSPCLPQLAAITAKSRTAARTTGRKRRRRAPTRFDPPAGFTQAEMRSGDSLLYATMADMFRSSLLDMSGRLKVYFAAAALCGAAALCPGTAAFLLYVPPDKDGDAAEAAAGCAPTSPLSLTRAMVLVAAKAVGARLDGDTVVFDSLPSVAPPSPAATSQQLPAANGAGADEDDEDDELQVVGSLAGAAAEEAGAATAAAVGERIVDGTFVAEHSLCGLLRDLGRQCDLYLATAASAAPSAAATAASSDAEALRYSAVQQLARRVSSLLPKLRQGLGRWAITLARMQPDVIATALAQDAQLRPAPATAAGDCGADKAGAVYQPTAEQEREYTQCLRDVGFRFVTGMQSTHTYRNEGVAGVDRLTLKRRMRVSAEMAGLPKLALHWASSIFAVTDRARTDMMQALVVGPSGTPYENGCLLFDIFLPARYPEVSPKVLYLTTGGGQIRFNPNLYANGKVCLSLLGTWEGPGWVSGQSTLSQVLLALQGQILVDDPFLNEPGHGHYSQSAQGKVYIRVYNAMLHYATMKYLMLGQVQSPPRHFREVVSTHFRLKRDEVLQTTDRWVKEATTLAKAVRDPRLQGWVAQTSKAEAAALQLRKLPASMRAVRARLRAALAKL